MAAGLTAPADAPVAPPAAPSLVPLGPVAELAGRKRTVVSADGVELLVLCIRRRFTVLENRCPHLGLPLDDARVVGRTLVCGAHGYKYALTDGAHIPGWRCSSRQVGKLNVLATVVQDGVLYASVDAGGPR